MQHEPQVGIRASAEHEPTLVIIGEAALGVLGERSGDMCVLSLSIMVLLIIGIVIQ